MKATLTIKKEIKGLNELKETIEYVDKLRFMQKDKDFQLYIQKKCMRTLNSVMNKRLIKDQTTNDGGIDIYRTSNHILEFDGGFIIYNDAKIDANVFGVQNDKANYPDGMFNLALAFEYGVGIVGQETMNSNAWSYNVNNYNFGWVLPRNVLGKSGIRFMGYKGFEIYRYTAEEIEKNLLKWIKEYMKKGVVVNDKEL